jgi:hypothetical protein
MKLTKKSFRDRVKKLFAKVMNYSGTVTNSILKKFFPDFKVSVPTSWADLADELTMIEEKSELELACEKLELTSQEIGRGTWKVQEIYKNNKFVGELTQNFLGQWQFAFKAGSAARRASSLESALRAILNNHQANLNFANKSKEYYDLFSA